MVFPHLTPIVSIEALDALVTAGKASRETRDELDLAALGRGEFTMRRVTIYRLRS